MKLKTLPNREQLRIALDLDDTIFDWVGKFSRKHPKLNWNSERKITRLVYLARKDKQFWENLPLLEFPNFEPVIYATKRISSKIYTRNNLKKYGLPIKPIYQTLTQCGNKADIIKGHCDVLVDDSVRNVLQAINAGLPAIVITRPHNEHVEGVPRVNTLTIEEITEVYYKHFYNELK